MLFVCGGTEKSVPLTFLERSFYMKSKLKVVICVVMTCVFLLIPFSAFAYPDNPSPKLLYMILHRAPVRVFTRVIK